MSDLLGIFLNNLLPIFLIAGLGVLLARFTDLNPRSLSQLILYIFSPCLIFTLLTQSQVSNQLFLKIVLFSLVITFVLGGVTWGLGRSLRLDRTLISSMLLATMFANAGNYGLPVVLFAFGEEALSIASLFFVINISLAYTAGTVIASMSNVNLIEAVKNLLKLPLVYAVLLAFLFINTGWQIPLPLARATNLLGDASIPSMLIMLGLQLKSTSLKTEILPIGIASVVRLVLSPLLAVILLPLFGLNGDAGQTIALQAGMPTAVMTTLITTEYNAKPDFTAAAVFFTTLLSPLTITPLLSLLGA